MNTKTVNINQSASTSVTCAVLGPEYSYHSLAAKAVLGQVGLLACQSFTEVITAVTNGQAMFLVAVENSSIGPITAGKTALETAVAEKDIIVTGNYTLPINHCLIGAVESTVETVERVISHPAAFKQCQQIITNHGWETTTATDTASAVQRIAASHDPTMAAIASGAAAQNPNLKILKSAIQDQADNHSIFKIFTAVGGLSRYRQLLDRIDAELLHVLSARQQLIKAIAYRKQQNKLPTEDINREQQVVKTQINQAKPLDLDPQYIHDMYRVIFNYSKRKQEEQS